MTCQCRKGATCADHLAEADLTLRPARIVTERSVSEEDWRDLMGDDGTGHCRGCSNSLDRINPDCEVCVRALCAFMDDGLEEYE